MVPGGSVVEAGLLSLPVLSAGTAHGHVGERGVCAALGAAGRGTGGVRPQCFSLQKRLRSHGNSLNCDQFLRLDIQALRTENTLTPMRVITQRLHVC